MWAVSSTRRGIVASLPAAILVTAVTLDPGQRDTVTVRVDPRALRHWDERAGAWAVEPGTFDVLVARHADTTELTTLETPPRTVAT